MRLQLTILLTVCLCTTTFGKGPKITDAKNADKDFAIQGEYEGTLEIDGSDQKIGVQIIALGEGKFESVGYFGGLPGAGWSGADKHGGSGEWVGDKVIFEADQVTATVHGGELTVDNDGSTLGTLKRIERKSPTLGQKPPEGAVVLFDGKSADGWKNGKVKNGSLVQGTTSDKRFQSHKLHIEFALPYQPEDRGQARGNSGIYLQGRYEVQMLDSFGLEGENNECGGIYTIKKPDVNMCLPPLQWQTYDIEFHAADFDGGKMVKKPTMTVRHNGVVIHKNVELPNSTTAAPLKPGAEPGPVYLQDHGCPVRYRNIWVVEL
ncbi:MAG: DUF1080 domain-containing protein [Planctomycetales bacterium]|nr:DUF1080 domain-containing protein [Planctomycetales bacterium]